MQLTLAMVVDHPENSDTLGAGDALALAGRLVCDTRLAGTADRAIALRGSGSAGSAGMGNLFTTQTTVS